MITGGNAGLGYYTAEQLAAHGHRIILASRNPEKAAAAIQSITERVPDARVAFQALDLASLSSVETATQELRKLQQIDALLLNAGVVGSRKRRTTADGFELQIGTNHLGHFALVAGLLPKLQQQHTAKIIHLGSISHRWARISKNGLFPKHYRSFPQYSLSKLAVMTFGFELARRLEGSDSSVQSIVAHPGFSWDHFDSDVPEQLRKRPLPWYLAAILTPFVQGKRAGATVLSHVIESTKPKNGDYWGPSGFFQLRGTPTLVRAKRHSYSAAAAAQLWQESEQLTGTRIAL